MQTIKVKAPVRIDLAGGWTDVPPYSDEVGGCVVNATIDKYVEGKFIIDDEDRITVHYKTDVPVASGLGTSATMNVVWLKLIKSQLNNYEIAEKSFWLEKLLGIAGGRQDQYASAIGGINYMTFHLDKTEVFPIRVSPSFIKELENHLVLCYTGKSRLSSNIIMTVMKKFKDNEKRTVEGLETIRKSAQQLREAMAAEDFNKVVFYINQNWKGQKMLADEVTTPQIEEIFKIAFNNGAIGGKACGAGGGGTLLFLGDKKRLQKVLSERTKIIPVKFEFQGLQIEIS